MPLRKGAVKKTSGTWFGGRYYHNCDMIEDGDDTSSPFFFPRLFCSFFFVFVFACLIITLRVDSISTEFAPNPAPSVASNEG